MCQKNQMQTFRFSVIDQMEAGHVIPQIQRYIIAELTFLSLNLQDQERMNHKIFKNQE